MLGLLQGQKDVAGVAGVAIILAESKSWANWQSRERRVSPCRLEPNNGQNDLWWNNERTTGRRAARQPTGAGRARLARAWHFRSPRS